MAEKKESMSDLTLLDSEAKVDMMSSVSMFCMIEATGGKTRTQSLGSFV